MPNTATVRGTSMPLARSAAVLVRLCAVARVRRGRQPRPEDPCGRSAETSMARSVSSHCEAGTLSAANAAAKGAHHSGFTSIAYTFGDNDIPSGQAGRVG